MTKMTTAELRGYRQICDADGMMMVIACDQRGGMRTILADEPEAQKAIGEDILGDTKADITRYLANEASCVLLDAVCAVPRVVDEDVLGRDTGLLIGLDASGWDTSPEGYRLSKLVPGITARACRDLGATGGKIMVYLRADTPAANAHNVAIMEACIADFNAEGLLLVTEFLTYPLEGESKDDYAAKLSSLIVEGTKLCLAAGAKVLKLPYPGSVEACATVTRLCGPVPWAVLSAGVSHEIFLTQVETAMANGASGVIAGRALWKDCISLDRGVQKERLITIAVPRLREIQAVLGQAAGRVRAAA